MPVPVSFRPPLRFRFRPLAPWHRSYPEAPASPVGWARGSTTGRNPCAPGGRPGPAGHIGRHGRAGALSRRRGPPSCRARSGRIHPGASGRGRPGVAVPPVVLQRPPRSRLPLPPGHGRLRGCPARRPPVRRTGARRGRRGGAVPEHHRGHQPPGLPAAALTGRRGGDHGGRAPRQPVALGPDGRAPLCRVRARRHLHPR